VDVDTLLAFMRGQLDEKARDAVELHIDGCEDCQALQCEASLAAAPTMESVLVTQVTPLQAVDVAGRYRVDRFVARGGMGDIYAVHDLVLDEGIALKTITAAAMDDAKAILRLKAEVKLARRVCSPYVCRIFDYGEHEDRSGHIHFLTMEFVEGESLGHRLRARGKPTPREAAVIARQLLEGLLAAHAVGVLHRDFKSDNVMLRAGSREPAPAPHAVIMDFGLARALHEDGDRLTSHTQALLGSAAYMAPEQVEGSELSERADVYAFGVVLFEMLTGTLPFRGGTPLATALLRLRSCPARPSELVPGLDSRWDELVLGCMERQPSRRLSCEQALELLSGILRAVGPRRRRLLGLFHPSRSGAFVWGVVCTVGCGVLAAATWPHGQRSWLRQEVQAVHTALGSAATASVISTAAVAVVVPRPRAASDEQSWMLDAAQVLVAQWRVTADERACRQASAMFRRVLEQPESAPALKASANEALSELGSCIQSKISNRAAKGSTTAAKRAPAVREPAQRQLPSEDPVDGLFGTGAVKPP
jgi:predicted Ser/Thr protein kinase